MDEGTHRLRQLDADLEAAKAKQLSAPPLYSIGNARDIKDRTTMGREAIGSLVLGGTALLLALWGIMKANETARLNLETARLSVLPSLEFVIDTEKQTLSLQNHGNGPATIYYVKLTHRDWTIEQHRNSPLPDDFRSFFPVVLSNLYNDPAFAPETTTSGMTRVLADGASLPLLSIDTPMTKAQKDKLSELPRQVKIELCYTNMLADTAFWAGLGTDETTPRCPRPPQQGSVNFTGSGDTD